MMMENAPLERDIPTAVMMTQWHWESCLCGLQGKYESNASICRVQAGYLMLMAMMWWQVVCRANPNYLDPSFCK